MVTDEEKKAVDRITSDRFEAYYVLRKLAALESQCKHLRYELAQAKARERMLKGERAP